MLVSSGVEFSQVQAAQDEILVQLAACQAGQFEDWELEAARRSVVSALTSTGDAQSRLENFWLGQAVAGLSEDPAALARRGVGIAFTYRSCIEESRDVIYLSIGKSRCYVNLALIYPQEGYRSRAIRAFENAICRVLASEVF